MRFVLILFVAVSLLASACSGSGDDDATSVDEAPSTTATTDEVEASTTTTTTATTTTTTETIESAETAAELGAAIGSSFSDSVTPISDTEETCIGEQTISALGQARLAAVSVERASSASFDPAFLPDLTDAERDQLTAVIAGCVDLKRFIADFYGDGDQALTSCSFELFSAEDGRNVIRAGMNPDTDAGFDAMFDIFGKADPCFLEDQDALPLDTPEALAVAIAISSDDGTGVPTPAENQCVAEGTVSTFGVERLAEIGLTVATVEDFTPATSPTMTDAERDIYLDALGECLDLKQFTLDVFGDGGTRACLDETLTLDDARRFWRGFLFPVDHPAFETPPDVQAKFDACPL